MNEIKMDRQVWDSVTFETQNDDLAYWLTKTPAERLEALELLRQIHYGYDPVTTRLPRVFEIIESTFG
ncbi:hypothetical protein [Deinococcus sp.]|uniref:hypothetical protein n=1 Tax=Deinococcus sp. TaxID=47478 RepID=UPI0025D7AAD7|nr:hypothetical protein [Deinococcus sp.]